MKVAKSFFIRIALRDEPVKTNTRISSTSGRKSTHLNSMKQIGKMEEDEVLFGYVGMLHMDF